jgi:MraZ protein
MTLLEAMFLGEFRHTLDEKGRITLPAKYRPRLASGIVLTTGTKRFVLVFPLDEFESLAERMNSLSLVGSEASMLRRQLFSNGFDLELDKQGRVILPEPLRQYAGISQEVVIAGVGNHIEIWNPEEWQHEREEISRAALENPWAKLGI